MSLFEKQILRGDVELTNYALFQKKSWMIIIAHVKNLEYVFSVLLYTE